MLHELTRLVCLQPRLLHVNAVTDAVENVTFMHMPAERRAVFEVPVRVRCRQVTPRHCTPVTYAVP